MRKHEVLNVTEISKLCRKRQRQDDPRQPRLTSTTDESVKNMDWWICAEGSQGKVRVSRIEDLLHQDRVE